MGKGFALSSLNTPRHSDNTVRSGVNQIQECYKRVFCDANLLGATILEALDSLWGFSLSVFGRGSYFPSVIFGKMEGE